MDCSTPGLPVNHQLPEFTQTHVHWVGDAIQPFHPLSSPSSPAFNLSQHQGLFKWVVLHIRWPKNWSFSFSISPSNEYSGLISFRMDWLDCLAVQGTLKSLLQHHSAKASILRLFNGIGDFIKEISREILLPFCHEKRHKKCAIYELESSHHTPNLWVPWCKTYFLDIVRNEYLLFISYPFCEILLSLPKWTRELSTYIFSILPPSKCDHITKFPPREWERKWCLPHLVKDRLTFLHSLSFPQLEHIVIQPQP